MLSLRRSICVGIGSIIDDNEEMAVVNEEIPSVRSFFAVVNEDAMFAESLKQLEVSSWVFTSVELPLTQSKESPKS